MKMYKFIVFLAMMTTHYYYFILFCCCIFVFFTKHFWWLLHIAICDATNTSMDIFCATLYCCIFVVFVGYCISLSVMPSTLWILLLFCGTVVHVTQIQIVTWFCDVLLAIAVRYPLCQ